MLFNILVISFPKFYAGACIIPCIMYKVQTFGRAIFPLPCPTYFLSTFANELGVATLDFCLTFRLRNVLYHAATANIRGSSGVPLDR